MVQHRNAGTIAFAIGNYAFLVLISAMCVFPLVHVLAVSFSSSSAASSGLVKLWPVDFTLSSYQYVASKKEFLASILVTLQRVLIGTSLNMILTIMVAYPLSKEVSQLRLRTLYVWVFVFTMLFYGGLIPTYILVKELGMLDTMAALVLPTAVPIFNVILLLNFFRGVPKELLESAFIDGAGHWKTLWKIVVPVSLPVLATITLFAIVFHWNAWFDGLIYMNSPSNYPLSSYLQTIIVAKDLSNINTSNLSELQNLSDRTVKSAQIFLGALPVLIVYPFLQKYFIKGIVMGSVKE